MHEGDALWLAWCGTYLAHSTVVLGVAWWLTRTRTPGAAIRDALWKCAIVLPFVTSGLQVGWPEGSIAPRFELAMPPSAEASAAPPAFDLSEPNGAPPRAAGQGAEPPLAGPPFGGPPFGGPPRHLGGAPAHPAGRAPVLFLVALLWSCLVLLVPEARLALRLRRREAVPAGPLLDEFSELHGRSGLRRRVRLTWSDEVRSPIAFGVLIPEICLPRRAADLPPALVRALLAHELAHHARLDPLWTRVAHAVASLGWMQPLHRVARRELARAAEFLADDQAVSWTRDREGLARCLAEVTGWLQGPYRRLPGAVAVAMVRPAEGSSLRQRVERALDGAHERRARLAVLVAALTGGLVALGAPGFAIPDRMRAAAVAESERVAVAGLQAELDALQLDLGVLADHPSLEIRTDAAAALARLDALRQATARLESIHRERRVRPQDPSRNSDTRNPSR